MRFQRIALAGLVSCSGGGRTQIEIKPPPPKLTTGTLAGSLCKDGVCACRSGGGDGGAGYPAEGHKRFEIQMHSAYDLWLTLPGTVLYKSPEKADACFYVDLAPGYYPFQLRASNPNGVSFAFEIHELGTATHDWYDTFAFGCGHPGVCSFDELDGIKSTLAAKHGIHDICGSSRIRSVIWDHGKSPDQFHPSELAVQATLDVGKKAPTKPHGDPTCNKRDKPAPDAPEEPPAEP
jgi:hypothetical protein